MPARQRLTVPQPDINVCGNEHVEVGHTNQEGDSHGILCEMRCDVDGRIGLLRKLR